MEDRTRAVDLAERVAEIASGLGIQTAIIGAYALAAHHYVRGTEDIDLAADIPLAKLRDLERAVQEAGLSTKLRTPSEDDTLGGVLVVWAHTNDEGVPIDPVDVVNFTNPFRPRVTPAHAAIKNALALDGKPSLRYPRLGDLIALKLYAGGLKDQADVVEVLTKNPDADWEEIRATCQKYRLNGNIDELIALAQEQVRRR